MTTKNKEEFIEKSRKVHGDKYDYSKVHYEHSKKKVEIICPIHGTFEIRPNNHLNGQGCPKCGKTKRMSTEEFISRAMEVHGEKYDYSKVEYVNNYTKVCIICPKHGEFWQIPSHHLKGVGCKKCFDEKKKLLYTKPFDEFKKEACKIHGKKYIYNPSSYKNNETKTKIICPIHGEFYQTPHNHLNGNGCPECKKIKLSKIKTKGLDNFINEAAKIHNGKYDYSKAKYINEDEKICIICPKHGEFWQMPKIHLRGCGCPSCNSSKLERKIETLLKRNDIDFIPQCGKSDLPWIKPQHLDFYLPKYNIAIECQGGQHYKPVNRFGGEETFKKTIIRDERKRALCEKHNVKLLYFSDTKWEDEIITNENNLLEEIKKGNYDI